MFLSGCCNINQRFVSASISTEAKTVIINLVIVFYFSFEKMPQNIEHGLLPPREKWVDFFLLSFRTIKCVATDSSKTESIP